MSDNRYCPLCSNNPLEERIWNEIICQPICCSCSGVLGDSFDRLLIDTPGSRNDPALEKLTDISGLPLEECAAIWVLQEIDELVHEFREYWEYSECASMAWSLSTVTELQWRLNDINTLFEKLSSQLLKDTPQVKYRCSGNLLN